MGAVKRGMQAIFLRVEAAFEAVFGPRLNPVTQLGTLGWFLIWIVTVSGIYLYVFFDTGITGTYESIEAITHAQWWAGGVMRRLHRYASDALVVLTFAHLLREFAHDRMRGNHWFAWITGLPLLLFIYVCGITGYNTFFAWLVGFVLSGYLLDAFCPDPKTLPAAVQAQRLASLEGSGPMPEAYAHANWIWLVFAAIGLTAFLLLLAFRFVTERADRIRAAAEGGSR